MPDPNDPKQLEDYQQIVAAARGQTQFFLKDLKVQLTRQPTALVTEVVHELASQGWLIRSPGVDWKKSSYRWNRERGEFDLDRWLSQRKRNVRIAETPPSDRPRERLLKIGAENLMTSELLAILIRSGRAGESAVQAGVKIANRYADQLDKLPVASPPELKSTSSVVATTAYCQIMAGIELGRRITELSRSPKQKIKIRSAHEAIQFCEQHFRRLIVDGTKEEFHIVTLDTKNQIIDTHQISMGTLDSSLVHPREVFKPAIKDSAMSIILVHTITPQVIQPPVQKTWR